MRCSDRLASDPVSSETPDVDCDVTEADEHMKRADPLLRRISSLPEDSSSTSQNSPTTRPSLPHQAKATARSSSDEIVAERAKQFSEKGPGIEKAGWASPSSSSQSSRCSRYSSTEFPSHSGEYCFYTWWIVPCYLLV